VTSEAGLLEAAATIVYTVDF